MTSTIRLAPFELRTRPSVSRMNALDRVPASTIIRNVQDVSGPRPHNSRSKFQRVVKLLHKLQVKRKKDVSETRLPLGSAPLPHRNTRSAFRSTDESYMTYSSAESSASSSTGPDTRLKGEKFGISFSNVSRSTADSSVFTRGKKTRTLVSESSRASTAVESSTALTLNSERGVSQITYGSMNSAFAPSEVFMRYSGPSSVSALSPSARPESYLGSSSLNTPEEVAGPVVETLQRSERLEADAEQQARSEPPVLVIGHATAPSVLVIPPSPIPAQQSGSVAMADFEPEAPRANVEDLLVATYGDGPGSTDDTLLQVPVVQWPPRGSEVDAQDLQPARALERFVMPAPSLSPPVTMNSQRLRSKPRFALTFPDLVPSDCEYHNFRVTLRQRWWDETRPSRWASGKDEPPGSFNACYRDYTGHRAELYALHARP